MSVTSQSLYETGWPGGSACCGDDPQTSEHGECTSALDRRLYCREVRLIAAGSRAGVEPAEQLCGGKLWAVTLASGDAPMRLARLQPQPQPAVRHGRRRAQPVAAKTPGIPRPSHFSATPRFHQRHDLGWRPGGCRGRGRLWRRHLRSPRGTSLHAAASGAAPMHPRSVESQRCVAATSPVAGTVWTAAVPTAPAPRFTASPASSPPRLRHLLARCRDPQRLITAPCLAPRGLGHSGPGMVGGIQGLHGEVGRAQLRERWRCGCRTTSPRRRRRGWNPLRAALPAATRPVGGRCRTPPTAGAPGWRPWSAT